MKDRQAKICLLLPFAIYGVLLIMPILERLFFGWNLVYGNICYFIILFGWIPSLISSICGIVFSSLALKDGGKKAYLIYTCVNLAVAVVWGIWALYALLSPYPQVRLAP